MARTRRNDVEERTGLKVTDGTPLWDWLADHSATLVTRCQRSRRRGQTAYDILRGKPAQKAVCPFAENIFDHPLEDDAKEAAQDGEPFPARHLDRCLPKDG